MKFSFLVGKSNLCPLGGEGDVYRRCEGVKGLTTSLMRERAEQGSLVPASDPVIKKQVARIDRDHPMICPYFINSRIYLKAEGGCTEDGPVTPVAFESRSGASPRCPAPATDRTVWRDMPVRNNAVCSAEGGCYRSQLLSPV